MRSLLAAQARLMKPDSVELAKRNHESGLHQNVPLYSQDPTTFIERSVWVSLQNWPRIKYFDGTQVKVIASSGMSTDRGDANVTLTRNDAPTQYTRTTLTANRTWTLSGTSGTFQNGDYFEIVSNPAAAGAFTLVVVDGATSSTLVTIPVSTKAWLRVEHNGTSWLLTAYGTFP